MTGKELLLVLAGTAVAAGGAGVAAAVVMGGAPDDGADRTARILDRLDELDRSLDGTRTALDQNREAIDELGDRISSVELQTVGRPGRVDVRHGTAAIAPDGSAPEEGAFHVSTGESGGLEGVELPEGARRFFEGQAGQEAMKVAMKKLEGGLAGLGGAIATSDGTMLELSGALKGLAESFELRKLPEEERWEKARTDLGLTQNQIDELQAASDERDEALESAMKIERSETSEGGGHLTVKTLDSAKAKEAQDAYRRRVDNNLNDEQRKGWREKGYDRAFGKSGMGGGNAVIAISTSHTFSSEESTEEDE
jgi:hypothetical protein